MSESYHGQVLEQDSGDEGVADRGADENLSDWHLGKLKFKKHIDDKYRMNSAGGGSDGRSADDYTVVDPRAANSSNNSNPNSRTR